MTDAADRVPDDPETPDEQPRSAHGTGASARPDGSGGSGDRAVVVAAISIIVAGALALGLTAALRGDESTAAVPSVSVSTTRPPATATPAEPWVRRDSLRTPRDDFGTVVIDDRVYVAGGMTGDRGNKLATMEIYDPETDAWSMGPSMPTARSSLTAAVVDGVIYTAGGSTLEKPYLDVVESYDPATDAWSRRAPLPVPRYEHAGVAIDGKVYAIGGQTQTGPTADVQVYDPATDSWTAGPPLLTARGSLRAVVWDGKIWAGGGNTVDGPSDSWEIFDPATQTWSPGPSMPATMYNFGLALYDDALHAIYHANHFVLAAGETEWRTEEAPPIARHGMGMIQVGDVMYAIGGCTQEPLVDINVVQAYSGEAA